MPANICVPAGFSNKISVHPFTRLSSATPYWSSGRNLEDNRKYTKRNTKNVRSMSASGEPWTRTCGVKIDKTGND